MKIDVSRIETSSNGLGLVGRVTVNGIHECFSMENKKLSIASATYAVTIDQSPLFTEKESAGAGRPVLGFSPHILNVPNRQGIRVHSGSTHADEVGCIAVGQTHPDHQDFIGSSRLAVRALVAKIEKALGLKRAPGAPETRVHGEYSPSQFAAGENLWHYEKDPGLQPEDVTITVTDDFLSPSTTSAG
jgi:hypothetical protein